MYLSGFFPDLSGFMPSCPNFVRIVRIFRGFVQPGKFTPLFPTMLRMPSQEIPLAIVLPAFQPWPAFLPAHSSLPTVDVFPGGGYIIG